MHLFHCGTIVYGIWYTNMVQALIWVSTICRVYTYIHGYNRIYLKITNPALSTMPRNEVVTPYGRLHRYAI